MSTLDGVQQQAQNITGTAGIELFKQVFQARWLVPLISAAAALALAVALLMWASKDSFVPLSTHLGTKDTAEIIDLLKARNEPFRLDRNTGLILVGAERVQALQIELSGTGLSDSKGAMGLELLQQEQSLGTSQFIEVARYQHALETELSRTIGSMRNVESARVHLALPKRSVFVRNQPGASGSVMVKMRAGRLLERGQVTAMVSLVASSVPYLETNGVTVVDQWGRLLSSGGDENLGNSTEQQFEFTQRIENHYAQRIEDLLTPLVGRGRVRARVTASVDFSLNEQTEEAFEPDPQQVRSEQRQDQSRGVGANAATGIPGALANQPADNADPAGNPAAQATGGDPGDRARNLTRNYELDRTITHVRKAPGNIHRVSAAVIVDNIEKISESGEVETVEPSEQDIEQYTALVREAIGFDAERGDTVLVFNRPFQPREEIVPLPDPPIWEKPWIWGLAKQVSAGLGLLLLFLFVARPALRSLKPQALSGSDSQEQSAIGSAGELAVDKLSLSGQTKNRLQPPDDSYGDILLMAKAMAANDPKRVARVVKEWVAKPEE